mmetsp:Transcript_21985/g.37933  ORF Transcript_21985/g.37933 Transcript_21985/m.37933 type:complete len:419 (-) Transcript_21985:436-1692(-)
MEKLKLVSSFLQDRILAKHKSRRHCGEMFRNDCIPLGFAPFATSSIKQRFDLLAVTSCRKIPPKLVPRSRPALKPYSSSLNMSVKIHPGIEESDIPRLSFIVKHAFNHFNQSKGLGPEFPDIPDIPHFIIAGNLAQKDLIPGFVAELPPDDKVALDHELPSHPPPATKNAVGVVFIDFRSSKIAAIGPITVLPGTANRGIGRKLMQACLDEAKKRNYSTVVLQQVAANTKSFSLYSSMGFVPTETCACYKITLEHLKTKLTKPLDESKYVFRVSDPADTAACAALYRKVTNNVDRDTEIASFLSQPMFQHYVLYEKTASGQLVAKAFATDLCSIAGFLVAENQDSLEAFFTGLSTVPSLPSEIALHVVWRLNPGVSLWCLQNGFKLDRQTILMTYGDSSVFKLENNTEGSIYCPSILF